jgi:Restriction endonuclease
MHHRGGGESDGFLIQATILSTWNEAMPILTPLDLTQQANSDPKWLVYQKAVARLKESYGDCEVFHDHRIVGRRSGVERQVDIWFNATVGGQHSVTVAVECKCHETTPVSIKDVDAFYGFLDDVGANKGILISNTGFTDGASRRADGSTVELETLTLEEAEEFDWAEYLEVDECETPGYSCAGSIHWEFEDGKGSEAGYCGGCGSLHVKCGECGTVGAYDGDHFKCDGCDARWGLIEHKGEIIRFYHSNPGDEAEVVEEGDEG